MLSFTEIMVSSSMVLDHLPDNYVNHLNKLVEEWETERISIHHNQQQQQQDDEKFDFE